MVNYNPAKSLTGICLDVVLIYSLLAFITLPFVNMAHYLAFSQTPIFVPTFFAEIDGYGWVAESSVVYWGFAVFLSYVFACVWQCMQLGCMLSCIFIGKIFHRTFYNLRMKLGS